MLRMEPAEEDKVPKMTDTPGQPQGWRQGGNICTCGGHKQQIKAMQCQLCQQEIDTINLNGWINWDRNQASRGGIKSLTVLD